MTIVCIIGQLVFLTWKTKSCKDFWWELTEQNVWIGEREHTLYQQASVQNFVSATMQPCYFGDFSGEAIQNQAQSNCQLRFIIIFLFAKLNVNSMAYNKFYMIWTD